MYNKFVTIRALVASSVLLSLSSLPKAAASIIASIQSNQTGLVPTSFPPCDALSAAGLQDRLLFPTDAAYDAQINTWWALNARLRPWCLVLPRDSQELAKVVSVLNGAGGGGAGDWHIAVRSGGHHARGSNNIDNGVTIDLSMMNRSTYDAGTNLAGIQPGARWANVYKDLLKWNVTAPGGRDGGVGVGGFLLGGGSTFFMGSRGFACDSVTNYEVVLANGSIVNANRNENPDLWKALRGGGPNFGIVSRFDMDALPANNLSYSLRTLNAAQYGDNILDELHKFTNLDESHGADDALVVFYEHDTSTSPEMTVWYIAVNTKGNTDSPNFKGIKSLPSLFKKDATESLAAAAGGSEVADGTSNLGATLTFKNDPAMLRYCVSVHESLIAQLTSLVGADLFKSFWFLQPIPKYYNRISKRRGGNVLGLDRSADNVVLWTGTILVNETADATKVAIVHQILEAAESQIKSRAKATGNDVDLIYQNYADLSQNPLGSYGSQNVQFIRDVAKRYDPQAFFQNRVPGGFKISRVEG